jgi:hypothetical protein
MAHIVASRDDPSEKSGLVGLKGVPHNLPFYLFEVEAGECLMPIQALETTEIYSQICVVSINIALF